MRIAFRTLLPFLVPYRGFMALVLLSILAVTTAGLLGPWLIRSLVQTIRLSAGEPAVWFSGLSGIALALVVVYIVRSAGQFLNNHLSHVVAWNLCHDLRTALYRQLQRFSPAYYASRQTGEIVSRVIKDTEDVEPVVADVIYSFVVSALLAVGIVVVLVQLDLQLALLAVLPMPFAIAAVLWLTQRILPAFDTEARRSGELSALVQDNVAGIREIQVFNREHHELGRVHALSHSYAQDQVHARKLLALLQPIIEGATGLSIVLVVWFGGQRALRGEVPVEDLVAFVLYLTIFYQPLTMLVEVSEMFQRGIASLKRIREVLSLEPDVADAADGIDLGRAQGRVELDAVTFSYDPQRPVLHNITLTVAPGQTLALVGPTGAGKSTIVGLVARFYDPQFGQIRIDGCDVRQIRLDALRRNISMVLQDVFLFNGSVRENIRFGKPDATDAEIIAAAQAANVHDFISALPHGYDTPIGERGVKLSGGQKQRLSIARALLKDAPILILDEATSAVDSTTEAQIQQALERLRQGRTCIVIAHRLSTIRNADQIAVLDHGRVVELGRHDEIVAHDGLYRQLHTRQYALAE
ncbi:MAG: ABC transporter ATP-binding protein [Oscillochloris sp.]|nr:ABC transporter ATP-binding protein [Oscillochloris sp.]